MSELPKGWTLTAIGEITEITSGFGFPKHLQGKTAGRYPFAKVGDISKSVRSNDAVLCEADNYVDDDDLQVLRARPVRSGSTVFAKIGEALKLNRRAIAQTDVVLDNNCMAVSPKVGIEPRFVFQYMKTIDLGPMSIATTVPSVRRGDIESIPVALPPESEQRRIVAKLDSLRARSARARHELDLVPKLIERYKQAIIATQIDLAAVEATEFELGELLVMLTSGSRDWAQYYDKGSGVFVLAGNVRPMAFDNTPRRFVDPPRDGADARRSRVAKDDILLTIVGAGTGQLCRVPDAVVDYFVCQSVALLRLKDTTLSRWLELFLNSERHGGAQIRELIYGQGRPHLSFNDIKLITVKVPSERALKSALRKIERAFAWLDKIATEHARAEHLLPRLDQAILAKAFRGELVPQDPNDEPASVLLERIKAEREAAETPRRRRRTK